MYKNIELAKENRFNRLWVVLLSICLAVCVPVVVFSFVKTWNFLYLGTSLVAIAMISHRLNKELKIYKDIRREAIQ